MKIYFLPFLLFFLFNNIIFCQIPKFDNLLNSDSLLVQITKVNKYTLDSIIQSRREERTGLLAPYLLISFKYDERGFNIEGKVCKYDEFKDNWEAPFGKIEYTHNIYGQLESIKTYYLDEAKLNWLLDEKSKNFIYNSNNKLINFFEYEQDEDQEKWLAKYKYDITYNTYNNISTLNLYDWDEGAGSWEVSSNTEIFYDSKGNLVSLQNNQGNWQKKELYYYDSQDKLIKVSYLQRIKDDYDWEESGEISNILCDSYDNIEEFVNVKDGERSKIRNLYNNDISYEDIVLPYIFQTPFVEMNYLWYSVGYIFDKPEIKFRHLLKETNYSTLTNTNWIAQGSIQYYYSKNDFVSVKDTTIECFDVFPNPAKDFISFHFYDSRSPILEIYDELGYKIFSKNITNNEQVQINNLRMGTYFYRLIFIDNINVGKFIKL